VECNGIRGLAADGSDGLIETGLPTILVQPLTTQFRPAFVPMRVRISARNHLMQDCFVMLEHVFALDRCRFGEGPLASLNPEEMAKVEKSLLAVMGML
jgi:mRNA interferase MazF